MSLSLTIGEKGWTVWCGRNREFSKAFEQDYMADPRNCPLHGNRQLLEDAEPEIIDLPMFFRQVSLAFAPPKLATSSTSCHKNDNDLRRRQQCTAHTLFSGRSKQVPDHVLPGAKCMCALQAALWLAISAAVSVLLGIVFLMIFKYQPHAATKATIVAQVSICHLARLTAGRSHNGS